MSFLNRVKHGLDVTKFKADQVVRINKIQSEINAIQMQVSSIHTEIARVAVALHRQGQMGNTEIERLCADIDGLEARIAEKEAQIEAVRAELAPSQPVVEHNPVPENMCPQCFNTLPASAMFCPECGYHLPEPSAPQVVEANVQTCIHCGLQMPAENGFCPRCGRPVHEQEQQKDQEEIA